MDFFHGSWPKERALFVTGTDTGVGKTLITVLIALKLRQMGLDCGAFKPWASGCGRENGVLLSQDALFLKTALQLDDSLSEICPIRLEEPLAPLLAARRAGLSTRHWPEIARDAFENLCQKHEFVVVEGVGGLLAPISENKNGLYSNLDAINTWKLPAILVARRTLGTINHCLLTLAQPLKPPARFVGLVFNDSEPVAENDVAAQISPDFVAQQAELPVWAQIPSVSNFDSVTLETLAQSFRIEFDNKNRPLPEAEGDFGLKR